MKSIRKAALDLLSRREHTETELFRKLASKKAFAEEDIRHVIQSLTQEGLLSHTRFIEAFIHYRQSKGQGPLRIRTELLARGLTEDFIDQHLNISDNAWYALIKHVWQKRFKMMPTDYRSRAKQMQFLHYRGFTTEQIERLMKPSYESIDE